MLYPIELRARLEQFIENGGEERIRTSGSVLPDQPLSRRLPSATRPPLQARTGGGSRIRTHGALRLSGFQDRRLKPLGHPSARAECLGAMDYSGFRKRPATRSRG